MNIPETKFAMNGALAVACQVFGQCPIDFLVMPNFLTNVEAIRTIPELLRWYEHQSTFSRVILFDQPRTGASDPISLDAVASQ